MSLYWSWEFVWVDRVECSERNWHVVVMFLTAAVNMKWNVCIGMKTGTHSGIYMRKRLVML